MRSSVHLPRRSTAFHEQPEARRVSPLQQAIESRHARRATGTRHQRQPDGTRRKPIPDGPTGRVVAPLKNDSGLPRIADAFVDQPAGLADVAWAQRAEMAAADTVTGARTAADDGDHARIAAPPARRKHLARTAARPGRALVAGRRDADALGTRPHGGPRSGARRGKLPARQRPADRHDAAPAPAGARARRPWRAIRSARQPTWRRKQAAPTRAVSRHFRRLFGVTPQQYRRRRNGASGLADAS